MSLDTLTHRKSDDSPPQSRQRKKSLAWLLPVGLLLGFILIMALLFGDRLQSAQEVEMASVVTLRLGTTPTEEPRPAGGKGSLLFQASGWVEPDPYPVFVPSLVNGVVDEVHALEGQKVGKGDLVATLIDDDARLDLREAERRFLSHEKKIEAHCTGFEVLAARLTAAERKADALRARLDEARDAADRLAGLSEGAASRQEVVQARLAVDRDQALLAEAQAEIPRLKAEMTQLTAEKESMLATLDELMTARDRAQLALDRTRITAPMAGKVLHLHASPGMKRMLNGESLKSAVIVELYDPKKLQARIDVPLNEAGALRPGLEVEMVSELLPDTVFAGEVTRVTGEADIQRNTLQAKVAIRNPDERLRPEMLVRAKFFAPAAGSRNGPGQSGGRFALFVPEEAVVDDSFVWVVDGESTARKRTVTLSRETREDHRLVLEGLRSGETVILPPHDQLSEGLRVAPANPDTL